MDVLVVFSTDLPSPPLTRVSAPDTTRGASHEGDTEKLIELVNKGPRTKLARMLRDDRWFHFTVKLEGHPAQIMVDRLQHYADCEHTEPQDRRIFVRLLIKLSQSSGLYPASLLRTGIQVLGTCPIAAGKFGDVWKGINASNELIAVKILRIYERSDINKILKDVSSEIVTWRQLSHPNVLAFQGVWHTPDNHSRVALVSPWMDNGNLVQYLKLNPSADHIGLILDIAEGLKYLHELTPAIIHGDLKGVNILITPDHSACLSDFGLASAHDSQAVLSSITGGGATGTCRWQAPEILDPDLCGGLGINTKASDVYSFACVCYEVYSGSVPFHHISNDYPVMFSVTKGQRPCKPSSQACRIQLDRASDIWTLIEACWAQSPKRRPTAGEVVQRIRYPGSKSVSQSLKSRWADFMVVKEPSR